MEPTDCSETLAFNIQTPGKHPEEIIPSTTRRKFENYEYNNFYGVVLIGKTRNKR
jgi:hypothetical protein